jgi:type II secretory pathway pseudopilin PulG
MLSRRRSRGEDGFTVIETVVASAVLLVVLAIFFGALVSLTNTENRAENLVNNEQNVRFELTQMARDLRAGNPMVMLASKSTYANQVEVMLGPVGGTQSVVRWYYDTNPASPTYETLTRQLMSDSSPTATVLSSGTVLRRVRNVESSSPVFAYYGYHNGQQVDLMAGAFSAFDISNCSIRVGMLVISDSNPGPLPFRASEDVELRNQLPGGVGCGS